MDWSPSLTEVALRTVPNSVAPALAQTVLAACTWSRVVAPALATSSIPSAKRETTIGSVTGSRGAESIRTTS